MRKSVTSLICGLIGSLFSLFWGFMFACFGNLLNIIPADEAVSIGTVLTVLGWLAFFGGIVGIVGSALSVKQARKGAVCLSVATVMCGALQIYLFVKSFSAEFLMTGLVVFLLPTILLLVAAVFGWLAKEKQPAALQPQSVEQPKQEKTLEQELSELKSMLDKGLINEEEFSEAKKSILAKHTK